MKRLSIAALILLAGLALSVGGCKDTANKPEVKGGSGSQKEPAISDEDKRLGRKLEHYIKCINRHSRGVMNSRSRYLSWIEKPEVGPTCKERTIHGLHKLNVSPAGCARGLNFAAALKPKMEILEKAGAGFGAALKLITPLMDRAASYYRKQDYKKDACKKGKELHPELIAAWNTFMEADKVLRKEIDSTNRGLQKRELERSAKVFGKGLRYYHKKLMMDARRTLDVLRAQARQKKPDVKIITAATNEFQKTADATEALSEKKKAAAAKVFWWKPFQREASEFLKAAKAYMRRQKSGRAFSRYERDSIARGSGWVVNGSFPKVVREYNDLVRASNNVRFRR